LHFVPVVHAAEVGKSSVQGLKNLSIEELMAIEVTSVSRARELLAGTASAIQVVTGSEIRRFGATSLPGALRLANNLSVAKKDAHDWGVSARGFNTDLSNKLLVMMDGRTIYTPIFSGVRWDVQDYLLEDLDRIEVISGPGGTLWGANAVNGVINIISKSAADTQGLFLQATGGTQLRQSYGLRYGGRAGANSFYRVYAKYAERDSEVFANGADANDASRQRQAGFRVDSKLPADAKLTVQGDYYRGTEGFVSGGEAAVHGGNALGRWSRTLVNGSSLDLQVYFDRAHFRQPVAASPFTPAGMFSDTLDTYDLDLQHRLLLGDRQRVVWGLGYRLTDERSQPALGLALIPQNAKRELFSGFIQDEISLRSDLTMTVGSKLEDTHYTGLEIEPSVRLQWQVQPDHMVWTAVSRAVRTPSRIDRDIRQPSRTPVILQGGSDFASETLVAYELGYRTQLGPRFFASLAGFYNRYDKIRSARRTPVTLIPLVFANDLEGDTYGFELSATFQPVEWWRLTAGYNYLQGDIRVKPGGNDFNNALNETADPKHQFSLRSSMDLRGGLELDVHFRAVDELPINNVGRMAIVPAYAELDVRLGWRPNNRWEFAIIGSNLLDDRHPEYGAPSPTRVEIQRSVHGRLTWRF
jgi:iron complex outermembrane recepter protein